MSIDQKVLPSYSARLGQALNSNKLIKLAEILLIFLVAAGIIFFFISDQPEDLIYNQAVIWCANIIMLILVFTGVKLRGESLSQFGLSFKRFNLKFALKTFLQSLIVFVLATGAFILASIIMANIIGIPEASDMSAYNYIKGNFGMLALSLIGVYIVSSFGEEVVYRAFLINRISELTSKRKSNLIIAVLISSIIFGLAHYSWGLVGIIQTTFMGLALGFSYLYLKRKIWVLIIAHAYMDTILMVQLYLA
jgi:membrane protease YdiL (CAAX protease family)